MRFKNKKVGDTVYCSGKHSDSRQNRDGYAGNWNVIKSGRIYLTVSPEGETSDWLRHKINKDTGHSDSGYFFYTSKEECEETTERNEIVRLISDGFKYSWNSAKFDIPLEDLRTAAKLLKVKE